MKKPLPILLAAVMGLTMAATPLAPATAEGAISASVSIPSVRYNGTGNCITVPVTLNVSGGVSDGFAYWTSENENLSGPTSDPSTPTFFFDNEDAPGTESIYMCPGYDQPGIYTFSADVYYHDYNGDYYAGRASARFGLGLALTKIVKIARHVWQVKIVSQPYLLRAPFIYLQKYRAGAWRTIFKGYASNSGKITLRPRPYGRYRIVYRTDRDHGTKGSISPVFRRP